MGLIAFITIGVTCAYLDISGKMKEPIIYWALGAIAGACIANWL